MSLLVAALTAWLAGAALSPQTATLPRVLLLALAVLLPLHLVLWHLGGIKLIDELRSWPKPLQMPLVFLGLGTSPIVLYPLGLLALLVALFSGDVAGPALAVTGVVMLSPIIAIVGIAVMFMLGSKRR